MKLSSVITTLIIVGIFLFTKTETGKQFWFDVFRTFSKEHNINCTNENVVKTLKKVLTDNQIQNPSITGITTIVDKNRYKKCTGLLTATGEGIFGEFEQFKNLPIEYEVQVTDDGKSFTVLVRERY